MKHFINAQGVIGSVPGKTLQPTGHAPVLELVLSVLCEIEMQGRASKRRKKGTIAVKSSSEGAHKLGECPEKGSSSFLCVSGVAIANTFLPFARRGTGKLKLIALSEAHC